jgi:hypothetical protein
MKTKLYSGFPGVGKSYLFNNSKLKVLDSDSSTFDKSSFPQNYIEHIKQNIGEADIILISSHDVVRNALVSEGLPFTLVYPDMSIKDEYIQRYRDRGSNSKFVELLENNWEMWIGELTKQIGCEKIILKSGQHLSDVIR